ncbi:MAG TPA: poly(R)-hydroxyalkanoic acid synthase subunit PhaE [Desulfomonilia bacterium]|nr:poly(R)-hydroxyalkanoic acid synthase subunit PhaE [Desulfomonilia bacterium]
MNEKQSNADASTDFFQPILTMMNKFFTNVPGMMSGAKTTDAETKPEGSSRLSQEALLSIFKTWGTLSSAMSEPSAVGAVASGMASMPDIISKFFHTGMSGFLKINEQISDKLKEMGKRTEAYSFDNLNQDSVKVWSDYYNKEIRQYLKVPQLGLVRFYQERFYQTIDKFNLFSTTFTGFIQILLLPMEKAFKVLQDKIDEQIREGKTPEDPHEYYRLWVKILEGHFMTLFKSPEYNKALAETLSSYEEYLNARNKIVTDAMQSLPIPTNKDLDDLYDELYHLKKRVKDLERANKDLKKSAASGG